MVRFYKAWKIAVLEIGEMKTGITPQLKTDNLDTDKIDEDMSRFLDGFS